MLDEINILIAKSLIKKGFKKIGVLGLSYKGNYKGNDITITVIWGDGTKLLETGEAGYNDHEKEKLLNFFANVKKNKWNGFDTISIMFVIHYMFSTFKRGKNVLDKKRFEIFMKNIIDLLNKITGMFIGCYLSGANIMKNIGNSSCYVQKDSENIPFYGIFLKARISNTKRLNFEKINNSVKKGS